MLSVIVPFRGDPAQLEEQLRSLLSQSTTRDYEVIVADNSPPGSGVTERVQALVAGYDRVVRVDASDRVGAAYARNVGAANARGYLLAFVDADDVVGSGWLEAMAAALENHAVVASRFEYAALNPHAAQQGRKAQTEGLIPYRRPAFLPHAGGCGLGVRSDVFESVGGFNEAYRVLEDTDFAWRVQLSGHEIWFEPDAVVHIRLRPTLRGSFRQSFRYGEAHAQLQRDYQRFGMPPLGPTATVLSVFSLLRSFPRLFSRSERAKYVRNLANRLGRWVGSVRFRVWAG